MKKILWGIFGCVFAVILVTGGIWGVKIYQREQDPNWQLAKKLYNMETALQEIDGNWKLTSLTQVTPFCYRNPDGNTISYYCCTTTYAGDLPSECLGLDKNALGQVVKLDTLKNRRDCNINGMDAVMGESNGLTYLCWTISPQYSCVIEYGEGTVKEEIIFRIAESIPMQT